jgi:CopG family transcriptional regulator, nickel-responsive regulator
MQRITITIDEDLLAALDALAERRAYETRSEAIRDILREALQRDPAAPDGNEPCVAALAYVYDHHKRDLARRLTDASHARHDLAVATMHVHLDHDACLEVSVLKGPRADVRASADAVTSERGVRYGHLHLIPVETPSSDGQSHDHRHGDGGDADHCH